MDVSGEASSMDESLENGTMEQSLDSFGQELAIHGLDVTDDEMMGLPEDRCSFGMLCPFFDKPSAAARIFTDVKIDDCLFLWIFLLLSLQRPEHHATLLTVVIIGVSDMEAAAALVQHMFQCAHEHAATSMAGSRAAATIELRLLGSHNRAFNPPRHEADTYLPYRHPTAGFPPAYQVSLECYADVELEPADLVVVIAKFFLFEVLEQQPADAPNLDIVDVLVPLPGGVVAFQSGWNTEVASSSSEAAIWERIHHRVHHEQGGAIVLISNGFSFPAHGPRQMEVGDPFLEAVVGQSPQLWEHLISAGVKESVLFAADQLTDWLALSGISKWDSDDQRVLASELVQLRDQHKLPAAACEIRDELLRRLALPQQGISQVIVLCHEVRLTVEAACGEEVAEYLRRSVHALERSGRCIEVTDGQHMSVLFQNEVCALRRCTLPVRSRVSMVHGQWGGVQGMWAASGVTREQSFEWMYRMLEPDAHALVSME